MLKYIQLDGINLDLVDVDYNEFNKRAEIVFAIDDSAYKFFNDKFGRYDVLKYKPISDFYDFQERCCYELPEIDKVIFNPPATIVLWGDGTKTVVKCNEVYPFYDEEKGLAMCIAKKALGNKGNYYNTFKKWLEKQLGA